MMSLKLKMNFGIGEVADEAVFKRFERTSFLNLFDGQCREDNA